MALISQLPHRSYARRPVDSTSFVPLNHRFRICMRSREVLIRKCQHNPIFLQYWLHLVWSVVYRTPNALAVVAARTAGRFSRARIAEWVADKEEVVRR